MEVFEILFTEPWAYRALLAAVLVGVMCGVLGCFVVLRQMALIGDALSHAVLPGVVLAFVVLGYHNEWGFFIGSVFAGLVTAIGITWIQNNIPTKNDAAVGIVFTTMFAIGVIGISWISQSGGVHLDLKDFLFGNVLGVSDQDLDIATVTCLSVLLGIVVFYRYLFITTFQPVIAQTMGISVQTVYYFLMLLLSFAVVSSLQTVGVILVVSLLISPAATALLLSQRLPIVLAIAGFLGAISGVIGIWLSIYFETTPGPAITLVLTFFYLLASCFSPEYGFYQKYLRKRNQRHKTIREDILKQAHKLGQKHTLTKPNLQKRVDVNAITFNRQLKYLFEKKYFTKEHSEISLSSKGEKEAKRLVRAHRLWETYLVNKMGLTAEQIHDDAEKYEHFLTEDILDEVDQTLGFPEVDPHGSPIPFKHGQVIQSLSQLTVGASAKVAKRQLRAEIYAKLWELSIMPDAMFEVMESRADEVCVMMDGKKVAIPIDLARLINVSK